MSCRSARRRMMLCIIRVRPVPDTLKPSAMILRRGREALIGTPCSYCHCCRLALSENQSESLNRSGRTRVAVVDDAEARVVQMPDQHVDGQLPGVSQGKDRLLRRPFFADLQKFAADFVKLAANFVDQIKSLRREQDRPFRAFAIEL